MTSYETLCISPPMVVDETDYEISYQRMTDEVSHLMCFNSLPVPSMSFSRAAVPLPLQLEPSFP